MNCVCGAPLNAARCEGVWDMGDVRCEYRTCLACGSSRAWMPSDVVKGRLVVRYEHRDGDHYVEDEYPSLLDALERRPKNCDSELIRNGVVLAVAYRSPDGEWGWELASPEVETPCLV
jgi:hypothetical protein